MAKKKKRLKGYNRRKIILIFSFSLLAVTILVIPQLQSRQDQRSRAQLGSDCTVAPPDFAMDAEEQKLLGMLNLYRAQSGASALKLSPPLTRAAAWMSNDMVKNNYLSHQDTLGRNSWNRAIACGYTQGLVGENGATGVSADTAFNGWKGSPGHNANMLDPKWKVAGIGRSTAGAVSRWILDLGEFDDSASGVVPTAAPINPGAPSFVCLGACPTPTPTIVQPPTTPTPTPTIGPNVTLTPDLTASPSGNPNQDPNAPCPDPGHRNFIQRIWDWIIKLLESIFDYIRNIFGGPRKSPKPKLEIPERPKPCIVAPNPDLSASPSATLTPPITTPGQNNGNIGCSIKVICINGTCTEEKSGTCP